MTRAYTKFQKQAIETNGQNICVAAGAGSGKTGVLVERFVRLIVESREGILPPEQRAGVEDILVITFTDKATREMKTRIVEELTRLGLTEERRQVETAYISTIHGFCSRLLQENPFEVGIDPHFSMLDEPQAKRLLHQTVEAVIARAYEAGDQEITELVAAVQSARQQREDGYDPLAQLGASVESVLAKMRGAGYRQEDIERFSLEGEEATADRARQIVWSLLTPVLQEVEVCLEGLRALRSGLIGMARTTCDGLLSKAEAIRQENGSLTEILNGLNETHQTLRKSQARNAGGTLSEIQLAQILGRLKVLFGETAFLFTISMTHEEQANLYCYRLWRLIALVWKAYEEAKRERSKVDNDDLQAEGVRLLEESEEVRNRYRRRLRYLMIDEFQDTNPVQMRLIQLLHNSGNAANSVNAVNTENAAAGRHLPNFLFVVGDVQQSIYGFRNAEPSLFRDLERRYREEGEGVHVPLAVNFRSRPEILRVIELLFRQIWRESGARSGTPFVPLEPGAPFDAKSVPSLELLVTQDLWRQDYLSLEPEALARRVRQMVEGEEFRLTGHFNRRRGETIRYRDIAILLRQLTDIQKYEEAFARQGVPYFVVGGGRGYYARQEIRDLLNLLIVLDTPLNDLALMAALRSPIVGAELDTLYIIARTARQSPEEIQEDAEPDRKGPARREAGRLPLYIAMQHVLQTDILPAEEKAKLTLFLDVMESLRAQEDRLPVGHLMERLIVRTRYDARLLCRPGGRRRLANVRKLLQMANSDSVLGVRDFIRRLRDMEKLSDREGDAPTEEEAADVVRFHTIHGAKGLEFPVVILADLSRSLEHPEKGLFVCDPHYGALGTRLGGAPDLAYCAIDRRRLDADREEAERLLYVAMTRAQEHLILCGNVGRNRGLNWGDRLFQSLGILEAPPQPEVKTLIGGLQAQVAPLAHYVHASPAGFPQPNTPARHPLESLTERLVEALLNDQSAAE